MPKPGRDTLTVVGLAAMVVVTATAATAVATWRFVPGGDFTGTNVGDIVIADVDKGTSGKCNISKATVSGRSTWGSPTRLLTASELTLDHNAWPSPDECQGPQTLRLKVTVLGLPWRYDAQSYSAGRVTGRLVGVGAKIHGNDGCDFSIGGPGSTPGEVKVVYDNATDRVSLGEGNLVVRTADAVCDPTLLQIGDRISVTGTYQAKPGQDIEFRP